MFYLILLITCFYLFYFTLWEELMSDSEHFRISEVHKKTVFDVYFIEAIPGKHSWQLADLCSGRRNEMNKTALI